jgi:mono/diheme cytochrome c family protein
VRGWITAILLLAIGFAIGCASGRAARTPPQDLAPPVADGAPVTDGAALATAVAHRTAWDGVYTEEQSQRGEAIYFAKCVLCHRPEMTGSQIVPPLIGEVFLTRWNRRTAGDLFEWIRTSMPPVITSRLNPQEYADVLAYILNRNQFPAGREELATDFAALAGIRMAPIE